MHRASRPLTIIKSVLCCSRNSNSDEGVALTPQSTQRLPFNPSVFWQSHIEIPRQPPRTDIGRPFAFANLSSRSQ